MYVRTLSCALQSHGFGAWHPTLEINTQADERDFIDFTIHTVQEHTYVYIAVPSSARYIHLHWINIPCFEHCHWSKGMRGVAAPHSALWLSSLRHYRQSALHSKGMQCRPLVPSLAVVGLTHVPGCACRSRGSACAGCAGCRRSRCRHGDCGWDPRAGGAPSLWRKMKNIKAKY